MDKLYSRGGEDESGLKEVAEKQPPPLARADSVADLARQTPGEEEKGQSDGNVGRDEHFAVELREEKGEAEEDCVASLVRGEAVVVGERGRIWESSR